MVYSLRPMVRNVHVHVTECDTGISLQRESLSRVLILIFISCAGPLLLASCDVYVHASEMCSDNIMTYSQHPQYTITKAQDMCVHKMIFPSSTTLTSICHPFIFPQGMPRHTHSAPLILPTAAPQRKPACL